MGGSLNFFIDRNQFSRVDGILLNRDDTTRSPQEEKRVVEPDNTCGIHDHSRHRTAAGPNFYLINELINFLFIMKKQTFLYTLISIQSV